MFQVAASPHFPSSKSVNLNTDVTDFAIHFTAIVVPEEFSKRDHPECAFGGEKSIPFAYPPQVDSTMIVRDAIHPFKAGLPEAYGIG